MKKLKKKTRVNLWFSQREAQEGKFFFVPLSNSKNVTKCTAITLDKRPPNETSVFLSAAYLPIS